MLGLIDLTFFQLCHTCLKAQSIEDVEFSSIVLSKKRLDILQNCFQANKPVYLTLPPKKNHGLEGDDTEDKDGKKKKKWIKGGGGGNDGSRFIDLGNMVRSGSPVADWKIQGQKYKQIFTPAVTATTPHFNASGFVTCNKWHFQGICFEKRERKESAVHKSAFDKWVKELKTKNP